MSQKAVDHDEEGRALMELSKEWSDVVGRGDIEGALAFWAEDAVMMPPGMPQLQGREAIRGFLETAMQTPGFSIRWEPLSAHVAVGGDMAYLLERSVSTMADESGKLVTTHSKVVTVWRKQTDGSWKNVVDTWNEMPPPGE